MTLRKYRLALKDSGSEHNKKHRHHTGRTARIRVAHTLTKLNILNASLELLKSGFKGVLKSRGSYSMVKHKADDGVILDLHCEGKDNHKKSKFWR